MRYWFLFWTVSVLFLFGCGDDAPVEAESTDTAAQSSAREDMRSDRAADPEQASPGGELPVTCMAYWEGAQVEDGACVEGATSGCSNPFPYEDIGACCADNPDLDGCDEGPPSTCMAYWEGAVYEDGACVEAATSGCSNPYPYDDLDACCAAHRGADGCDEEPPADERTQCEAAGGEWFQFPNTCAGTCGPIHRQCGQALTWGCRCPDGACWDGDSCVADTDQDWELGPGDACEEDSECADGLVCDEDFRGEKICARGCYQDSDCPTDARCNTNIQCVTLPCPGQCQPR